MKVGRFDTVRFPPFYLSYLQDLLIRSRDHPSSNANSSLKLGAKASPAPGLSLHIII